MKSSTPIVTGSVSDKNISQLRAWVWWKITQSLKLKGSSEVMFVISIQALRFCLIWDEPLLPISIYKTYEIGPLLTHPHVQESRCCPPDLGTTDIFVRSDKPAVMIASLGTCRICVGLYSQPSEHYSHPSECYDTPLCIIATPLSVIATPLSSSYSHLWTLMI